MLMTADSGIKMCLRILWLMYWMAAWVSPLAADECPDLSDDSKLGTISKSLERGEIPGEQLMNGLFEELDEAANKRDGRWQKAGQGLGCSMAEYLKVIGERDQAEVKDIAERYLELSDLIVRLRAEFQSRKRLGALHQVAVKVRGQLGPPEKAGGAIKLFSQSLERAAQESTPSAERAFALDGLLASLRSEAQEHQAAENQRRITYLEDKVDGPASGFEALKKRLDSREVWDKVMGVVIVMLLITIFAFCLIMKILVEGKAGLRIEGILAWLSGKEAPHYIDRSRRSSGPEKYVTHNKFEESLEVDGKRFSRSEDKISDLTERLEELDQAFDRLERDSFRREELELTLSGLEAARKKTGHLYSRFEEQEHRVSALELKIPPKAPRDLQPEIDEVKSRSMELSRSLGRLVQEQRRTLEIERLALVALWQRAWAEAQKMPLLGPLANEDQDTQALVQHICDLLPSELDGDLKTSAEATIKPIREATLVVAKLRAARKFLEGRELVFKESGTAEELAETLFRVRDFSFHFQKLLHTEEGRRWHELNLETWIRSSFRGLADEICREHWNRQLAHRSDTLQGARSIVDDILGWGGLHLVSSEPGARFDNRHHIGHSTASNPEFGDGAIVGVVRVGFFDTKKRQVIQKPEVVVNRR